MILTPNQVVTAIVDLVKDCNIDVNEQGLQLQAMDTSHVCLVSLLLRPDGFELFRWGKEGGGALCRHAGSTLKARGGPPARRVHRRVAHVQAGHNSLAPPAAALPSPHPWRRCDRPLTLGLNLASLQKILKCAGGQERMGGWGAGGSHAGPRAAAGRHVLVWRWGSCRLRLCHDAAARLVDVGASMPPLTPHTPTPTPAGNDDIVTLRANDDGDSITLMFESPKQDRISGAHCCCSSAWYASVWQAGVHVCVPCGR